MKITQQTHPVLWTWDHGLSKLEEFNGFSVDPRKYEFHRREADAACPHLEDDERDAWAAHVARTHPGFSGDPIPVTESVKSALKLDIEHRYAKRHFWSNVAIAAILAAILLLLLVGHAKASPHPAYHITEVIIVGPNGTLRVPVDAEAQQVSGGTMIQFQQAGTNVTGGFFSYPFNFNCSTNVTCTASGNTLTITASATAATAWSSITAATNANAGTFALSGNAWDISAASHSLSAKSGTIAGKPATCTFTAGSAMEVYLATDATAGTNWFFCTAANTWTQQTSGVTSWAGLTSGANSNAGTFSATGNSWDFTGSTIFKLRVGAGATTSANGDRAFDSTALIWHMWQNGADKFDIAASNVGTAGQPCLSNADGSCTFADPVVSQPTASLLNAQVVGNVGSGGTDAGNPVKTGAVFNTTQPTVANGQRVDAQATARGAQIVATGVESLHNTCDAGCTATIKAGSTAAVAGDTSQVVALSPNTPLPAGGNTIGSLSANQSVNISQFGGASTSYGQKTAANSIPVIPASDYLPSDTVGVTVALNGANATATVAVSGQQGAGAYIISGGSLIGTIVPEVSYNGAGGPWVSSFFYNPTSGALSTSLAVNSPTDIFLTVLTPSGTSNARVRVSSFTSGSSNASMRATFAVVEPLPLLNSNPIGTEYGIVTRNIPSGTQTVTGTTNAVQSGTWTVQPGNTANTTPWIASIVDNGTPANKASVNASGQLTVNCAAGCAASAPADTTASGTLGAINNAVQIVMAGVNSAGFSLPASNNLVAVLTPESSTDGGTTWSPTLVRQQGASSFWAPTVSVSSTNANWNILVPGNSSHVRVRVSTYTSGSTTASLRATQQPEAFAVSVATGGSTAPQGVQQIGGSDGTNLRALRTATDGTLRVDPTGTTTQPVSGTVTTTPPANASTNVAQLAGTATDTNSGNKSAGTLRVVLATDQPALTNSLKVDGSAVTQPVSGTVTANAGTGTFNIQSDASVNLAQVGGIATPKDTTGRQFTLPYPDTTTTSYHASTTVAPAASATDIAVLPGNATNTVLVYRVTVSCTQTTAGIITLQLIKRSTADTAGTSASITAVPDDSNYAAGVSAPLKYTANPTLGTAVGNSDTTLVGCMATGTTSPNDIYVFKPTKPIVLRGTAQQLAVNLNGVTVTGGSFDVTYEYGETTTP